MVVCIYLIRVGRSFRLLVWPMMLLSLVLLVLPLFIGKETYGAKTGSMSAASPFSPAKS